MAGSERELLSAQLDDKRTVLLRKVGGLTDEQLRSTPTPSSLSLLGLLKHSAYVERWWFRRVFAGEDLPFPWTDEDPDADFRPEPHETAEQIAALYADEVERSRAIAETAGLDDVGHDPRGEDVTLRGIMIHMIQEVARHLGHADLIREAIDGQTGD
ncbi:MAG TPA: DinB family protein [Actinomycetota bacterium]